MAFSKKLVGQVRLEHSGTMYKVGHVLALVRFDKFVGETPVCAGYRSQTARRLCMY